MSTPQPRIRPGVPTGGRWADRAHDEADSVSLESSVSLDNRVSPESGASLADAPTTSVIAEVNRSVRDRSGISTRGRLLASGRYVDAVAVRADDNPLSSSGRGDWWGSHFLTAEYGGNPATDAGEFPKMPDDYTPRMTGGRALSGNRRTHRMAYRNERTGFAIRMPSATSVKAFAAGTGGTFDLPVSAVDRAGHSVSGWVRVTKGGNGYSATPLGGFGESTGIQVGEAVAAVLEARRPSRALKEVGDLLARRKERQDRAGTHLREVPSSFISGVSYEPRTGTMAVKMTGGNIYGYQVSRHAFAAVTGSPTPGGAYNRYVKGNPRVQVIQCRNCGRTHSAIVEHRCPIEQTPRPRQTAPQNTAAREAAAMIARRAAAR